MDHASRPVGRPLGALSRRILEALGLGPATAADLAVQLGETAERISSQLSRLAAAGHVHAVGTRPPRGLGRPVAIYAARQAGLPLFELERALAPSATAAP